MFTEDIKIITFISIQSKGKRKHMKNLFLYLIIAGLLYSCSKDESDLFDPYTGAYYGKLHKIVTSNPADTDSSYIEFKYDINGWVTNLNIINEGNFRTFTFSRNSVGQITSCIDQETKDVIHNISFNIDEDNKYISSHTTSNEFGKIQKSSVKYTYSENRVSRVDIISEDNQSSFISLKYDSKGNLIKIEDSRGRIQEGTYDKKSNPVESLDIPVFINIDILCGSNHNNILTKKYESDIGSYIQNYSYSYNKFDKPASANMIIQYKNGTGFTYSLSYIYY